MNSDYQLPKIDDSSDVLYINGQHGVCRAYYHPDEFDIKVLEYAKTIKQQVKTRLQALDLGCSPYFPQSQRLAKLGFDVDAFDLENPIDNFTEINQKYHNRIHYYVKNLIELNEAELRDHYQIIYSNRCLSFLSYPDTYRLIRMLIDHIDGPSRYFLAFFSVLAKYAENYPINLPLEQRYVSLNNAYAHRDQMLAPVCLYTRDEILNSLLNDLPISILELIEAKSGSLKIIFEKI